MINSCFYQNIQLRLIDNSLNKILFCLLDLNFIMFFSVKVNDLKLKFNLMSTIILFEDIQSHNIARYKQYHYYPSNHYFLYK